MTELTVREAPRLPNGTLSGGVALRQLARLEPDLVEALSVHLHAKQIVGKMRRVQLPAAVKFESRITELLRELGDRVADSARNAGLTEAATEQDRIEQTVDSVMNGSRLREWASARLVPAFVTHFEEIFNITVATLIKAGIEPGSRGAIATEILRQGGRRAGLLDIPREAREALFRALEEGRAAGLGPRETARLIRDYVPEGRFVNAGARYRAELIARSETAHAQRSSSLLHYRANGHIPKVVAFDGVGDEECAARNGQIFNLDEAEIENDATHPNCVLSFGPIALG